MQGFCFLLFQPGNSLKLTFVRPPMVTQKGRHSCGGINLQPFRPWNVNQQCLVLTWPSSNEQKSNGNWEVEDHHKLHTDEKQKQCNKVWLAHLWVFDYICTTSELRPPNSSKYAPILEFEKSGRKYFCGNTVSQLLVRLH